MRTLGALDATKLWVRKARHKMPTNTKWTPVRIHLSFIARAWLGMILGLGAGFADANAILIPCQTGPIPVEAINGTYHDEAIPGLDTTPLTVALRGAANTDTSTTNVSINATPLTEKVIRRHSPS